MSSRPVHIGFEGLYAQSERSYNEFEGLEDEYENNIPVNRSANLPLQMNSHSSAVSRSMPSRFSQENSHHLLLLPFLSAVYTEILEQWCQIAWLRSIDNQQVTYLVVNPAITGCLTIQTAINEHRFITPELPLLNQPECLLIRTEYNNQSLLSPNSIIALEHLFYQKNPYSHGKLIAIICDDKNENVMFYKALSSTRWAVFHKNQKHPAQSSANTLSNEHQKQLEDIFEQNHFIQPSQLSFPLSALCKHPIIFVYIAQKSN